MMQLPPPSMHRHRWTSLNFLCYQEKWTARETTLLLFFHRGDTTSAWHVLRRIKLCLLSPTKDRVSKEGEDGCSSHSSLLLQDQDCCCCYFPSWYAHAMGCVWLKICPILLKLTVSINFLKNPLLMGKGQQFNGIASVLQTKSLWFGPQHLQVGLGETPVWNPASLCRHYWPRWTDGHTLYK